jgi:hypothetical protein
MRSRSLPETVEEGDERAEESQEYQEETRLQNSNLSELVESKGGRDESLDGGNGCLSSEEGRQKGLEERQREEASHEDVAHETFGEEAEKEEPGESEGLCLFVFMKGRLF